MEYTISPDGRVVVNLYKRRLSYPAPDFRAKAEVRRDLYAALADEPDIYGRRELTICGLSGGRLEAAPGGGGLAWRRSE